jgi:hypothetical protein
VLGLALDPDLGIETTNDAVGLTEDLADLLDQRADLAQELLLAQLLLGSMLGRLDLLFDFVSKPYLARILKVITVICRVSPW